MRAIFADKIKFVHKIKNSLMVFPVFCFHSLSIIDSFYHNEINSLKIKLIRKSIDYLKETFLKFIQLDH